MMFPTAHGATSDSLARSAAQCKRNFTFIQDEQHHLKRQASQQCVAASPTSRTAHRMLLRLTSSKDRNRDPAPTRPSSSRSQSPDHLTSHPHRPSPLFLGKCVVGAGAKCTRDNAAPFAPAREGSYGWDARGNSAIHRERWVCSFQRLRLDGRRTLWCQLHNQGEAATADWDLRARDLRGLVQNAMAQFSMPTSFTVHQLRLELERCHETCVGQPHETTEHPEDVHSGHWFDRKCTLCSRRSLAQAPCAHRQVQVQRNTLRELARCPQ